MKKENQIVGNEVSVNPLESIENLILNIRGKQVMLDRDLARLYGVETKSLNQAVKRNIERFPEHFMFQLSDSEKSEVVTKCYHLKELKFSYQNPYAFTKPLKLTTRNFCVLKSELFGFSKLFIRYIVYIRYILYLCKKNNRYGTSSN